MNRTQLDDDDDSKHFTRRFVCVNRFGSSCGTVLEVKMGRGHFRDVEILIRVHSDRRDGPDFGVFTVEVEIIADTP